VRLLTDKLATSVRVPGRVRMSVVHTDDKLNMQSSVHKSMTSGHRAHGSLTELLAGGDVIRNGVAVTSVSLLLAAMQVISSCQSFAGETD